MLAYSRTNDEEAGQFREIPRLGWLWSASAQEGTGWIFPPAALRSLEIARYDCAIAPCRTKKSTSAGSAG